MSEVKKQVWLVDDDAEMSAAMRLMFRLLGMDTRCFGDARSAARALLAGETPDLMVLDMNMPEVTGLDLLEFVRKRVAWNQMPVIMLSAETADTEVRKALVLGANGYLFKPVTLEEVEKVTGEVMGGRRPA